ncbi:MAG: hypothetical protein V9G19_18845 [Tetrasphaera sp.]
MSPTLAEAADRLYAAPSAEFMALRTELVAEARAAKDRASAAAIGKLRKPSVAAALLNTLVRSRPDLCERLVSVGEQLRAAQANLHGTALTALRPVRDELLADVQTAAHDTALAAGGPLSPAAADEVRDTVIAALASVEATEAVVAGHLTRALRYSGFGEVDLADAVARTETGTLLRVIPGRRHTTREPGSVLAEPDAPEEAAEPGAAPEAEGHAPAQDESVDQPDAGNETARVDDSDRAGRATDKVAAEAGEQPESADGEEPEATDEPDGERPDPEAAEEAIAAAGAAYAGAAAAVGEAKQAVARTSDRVDAAKARVAELTAALHAADAELEAAFAADAEAREAVTVAVKARQEAARRLAAAQEE